MNITFKNNQTKIKKMVISVLSLGIMSAFMVSGLAAVADTGSSQASIEFQAGQLELNSVPDFDFGTHPVPATTTEYPAVSISNPLQVSDLRGSLSGWNVKAELSPFTSTGGTSTLAGANLKLQNASIAAGSGTVGTPPTASSSIVIPSNDTAVMITQATSGTGGGVWDTSWATSDANLEVFGGTARTGVANATLTWSLEDTP